MTVTPLPSDIKKNGLNQDALATLLQNICNTVNELVDDHATFITLTSANKTAINAVITAAATNIAAVAAVTPVSAAAVATLSDTADLTLNKG